MRRTFVGLALFAALALPATSGAQNAGQGATAGTGENFDLVAHDPLFNSGMNAAAAVYHNYTYIGNRADVTTQPVHPGILVVDTSNEANPTVVGEIPPPPIGQTTRELRVWPQQSLLLVMRFRCSPFTHGCPVSPPLYSIDFYDLSGLNARSPKLLTSYVPSRQPHEMFLWLDPQRRDARSSSSPRRRRRRIRPDPTSSSPTSAGRGRGSSPRSRRSTPTRSSRRRSGRIRTSRSTR